MAKSVCMVTLLMIFLLISAGIPNGKAQCPGEPSATAESGVCDFPLGRQVLCNRACEFEDYFRGQCDSDTNGIRTCNCYHC
ncbi:hypothetical protein HA466_0015320 [Hirschfeldia incana]|nr:hypothetical protein HA466_0015320 [Hirschfeldia incana]